MRETFDPCVLCGGRSRSLEYQPAAGNIVSCNGCGLVSLIDPATDSLVTCSYDASYYHAESHGSSVGYTDYFGSESAFRATFAQCLAQGMTSAYPTVRKALDVGCGGGYLVRALVSGGVDARGVDTSAYAISHGLPEVSGRLTEGQLSEMASSGPFDLITMMDVIEHLPDPPATVREAFSLLSAGGTLAILTPRYGGRLLDQQGSEYVHFNTDHMYYFTAETLHDVVESVTGVRPGLSDVLGTLADWNVEAPPEVVAKYTTERDSILATVTRRG